MGKSLRKADIDQVVVQTGRQLEQAARQLVPDERGPDGTLLMLGERMFRLRDHIDDESWAAYQAWAEQRNHYIHGQIETIEDKAAFIDNFEEILAELEALAEDEQPEEHVGTWGYVIVALLLVGLIYFGC